MPGKCLQHSWSTWVLCETSDRRGCSSAKQQFLVFYTTNGSKGLMLQIGLHDTFCEKVRFRGLKSLTFQSPELCPLSQIEAVPKIMSAIGLHIIFLSQAYFKMLLLTLRSMFSGQTFTYWSGFGGLAYLSQILDHITSDQCRYIKCK